MKPSKEQEIIENQLLDDAETFDIIEEATDMIYNIIMYGDKNAVIN